jgi:hypothetical protein
MSLFVAAAVAACLAVPLASAAAATRYASPTGTGAAPCTDSTAPCSIETAIKAENTEDGDTILLAPGTYHPSSSLQVFRPVTISGELGKAAPLIEATGTYGIFLQGKGTIVRDLRIHSSSGTVYGISMFGGPGTVVERVESTGEATFACTFAAETVRDSLCQSSFGPAKEHGVGIFIFISSSTPSTSQLELFNVTAVGGNEGLNAAANEASSVTVNATNSIFLGDRKDIVADAFGTTSVHVNLSHSNFETTEPEGAGATISAPTEAGNQSTAPIFIDPANGKYEEGEASPTRLAGDLSAVTTGELDLAGNPRTSTCAGTLGVDIGAYQFQCEPPDPPSDGGGGSSGGGSGGGSSGGGSNGGADDGGSGTPGTPQKTAPTAPVLSNLTLKPKKLGAKTTISFTLSAPASVKLEVLTKVKPKGKKPKLVKKGQLSVAGVAGTNKVKFNGKLKGRRLHPGKYTLRATATAGPLSSTPVSTTFKVLAGSKK